MNTNISSLKQSIIDRLSTEITTIQDTANYDKTTFRGFPAVCVVCSGNENDYWSNAENQRAFGFIIRIYHIIEDVPQPDLLSDSAKEKAEGVMERVVSQMLDAFDEFYEFGGNADFCRATPSAWGYAKLACGWCRVAEINLEVVKQYTIR